MGEAVCGSFSPGFRRVPSSQGSGMKWIARVMDVLECNSYLDSDK